MLNNVISLFTNPVGATAGAVVAVAVILTGASGLSFTQALFFEPVIDNRPAPVADNRSVNVEQILNRNFFGEAGEEPTLAIEQLPVTKLELVLQAIFAHDSEKSAEAVIKDSKTNVVQLYKVGDPIADNASVKAIYADRVVFEHNAVYESLYFPDSLAPRAGLNTEKNDNIPSADTVRSNDAAAKRREAIRDRIKKLRGR